MGFSRRGVDFATAGGGWILARAGGEGDGARAAAVQHEDAAHEVGGVEAGDGEGEDVVEDGGGAEVDEGEETGEDCRDADGVERDGAAGLYLFIHC